MMNMVAITGRTTSDIELTEKNGNSYIFFQVACDCDDKKPDGEQDTDFIPCVASDKTAKMINDLVKKGALITIAGRFEAKS